MNCMKRITPNVFAFIFLSLVFLACNNTADIKEKTTYTPDSKALYDSIVHMDSVLFDAYNVCDTITMASCFSEDIEFYHDKGGLMTNKDSIMAATKKYVCGKVTRVLIAGSIEVYPIANFGAIEMGQHYFINNQEPKSAHHAIGKFVHTWKKENGQWRLTRVISLH
jgi:Domain of unknown function (DUF4440)